MSSAALSTLHQLCLPPSLWQSGIGQIRALWQPHDHLILLGAAAQGIFDQRLNTFSVVYVLQADLHTLGITPEQGQCIVLNYDGWAQLVLQHQRHITWK